MTTVTPPAAPQAPPPAPPPAGTLAPLLTVSAPPEVLARLAAVQTLEVRVVDLPARNQVVVESPAGPLTLRTPQALPLVEGAKLTLQLMASIDSQVQARLTAVDGRPTAPLHAPAPAGPQSALANAGPVQWMVSQRPAGIPALLVQAPTTGHGLPAGPSPWPVGTELTVRLAALQPPGTGPSGTIPGQATPPAVTGGQPAAGPTPPGQPAPPSSPGASPATPALGTTAPGTTAPGTAAPGTTAPASPATAAPGTPTPAAPAPGAAPAQPAQPAPAQPAPAQPAPAQPATGQPAAGQATPAAQVPTAQGGGPPPAATPVLAVLTGTVQPHAAGAMPLITTPAGTIALQAAVPLPAGASVVLEVTSAQAPAPLPPAPTGTLAGGPAGVALAQAVTVLAASDADAARRLAAVLPGPDGRMLANTVAFAQAAASGDVRAWVGNDALRALERAGPRGAKAVRGLAEGLREATTTVRDSGGAEWRTLTMPFGVGGTVERIHIITRRQGSDEDAEDGGGKGGHGQRFLIQLDLSRLGALQLDGLYKKRDRRLDLVVRTRSELPAAMRRDLAGIFANSAMALALRGGMTFHVSDRFAGPTLGPDGAAAGMMV